VGVGGVECRDWVGLGLDWVGMVGGDIAGCALACEGSGLQGVVRFEIKRQPGATLGDRERAPPAHPRPLKRPLTLSSTASGSRLKRAAIARTRSGRKVPSVSTKATCRSSDHASGGVCGGRGRWRVDQMRGGEAGGVDTDCIDRNAQQAA